MKEKIQYKIGDFLKKTYKIGDFLKKTNKEQCQGTTNQPKL